MLPSSSEYLSMHRCAGKFILLNNNDGDFQFCFQISKKIPTQIIYFQSLQERATEILHIALRTLGEMRKIPLPTYSKGVSKKWH